MISDIFRKGVRVRVSGIIIRDEKVLLISHKKDGMVYWLLPGGGVRYRESLAGALQRELMEETGVTVTIGKPVIICDSIEPRGRRHILNISFLCDHIDGAFRLGKDKRLYGLGFFDRNELKDMIIYPPINDALSSIMAGEKTEIYLGSIWLEEQK